MDACYMPNNPSISETWRISTSPTSCSKTSSMVSLFRPPSLPCLSSDECSNSPRRAAVDLYSLKTEEQSSHFTAADQFNFSFGSNGLHSTLYSPMSLYPPSPPSSYSKGLPNVYSPMYQQSSSTTPMSPLSTTTTTSTAGLPVQPLMGELEPLPHFVTLSSQLPYKDVGMLCKEKGDHMADVLLSLKHAVVHPHQVGDSFSPIYTFCDSDTTTPMPRSSESPTSPSPSSFSKDSTDVPNTFTSLSNFISSFSPSPLNFNQGFSPACISSAPLTTVSMDVTYLEHMNNAITQNSMELFEKGHSSPKVSSVSISLPSFMPEYEGVTSLPSSLPPFISSPSLLSTCFNLTSQEFSDVVNDCHLPDSTCDESFNQILTAEPYVPVDSSGQERVMETFQEVQASDLPSTDSLQIFSECGNEQGLPGMMGSATCGYSGGYQDGGYSASPHMFPAMSVNVSMNMTMGVSNVNMGYSPEPPLQHHQWSTGCGAVQGSSVSPMACMNYPQHSASANLVSPIPMSYSSSTCNQPYGVGAYSWASELRGDPSLQAFDRDLCLKSPPLRPRPLTPPGAYLSPCSTMVSPSSPTLNCLRRRSCVGSMVNSGLMDKSLCGESLKTNLCRICGKTYARPSTLKTHLRTHSGEKPYRCNDCNKSFSQAANLTAHVRTHSGEKPFRCPICDRRFSQSSSVTTHMRTHSGERPYRCRMCKKAFSDSSTLTKHLRIHSGEKPYQCKLCLLRFSQSGNLNRHMRVHAQTS